MLTKKSCKCIIQFFKKKYIKYHNLKIICFVQIKIHYNGEKHCIYNFIINRHAILILAIILFLKNSTVPIDDMPTLRDLYDETITLNFPICQP